MKGPGSEKEAEATIFSKHIHPNVKQGKTFNEPFFLIIVLKKELH